MTFYAINFFLMSDAFTHQIFRSVIAKSLRLLHYQTASESSLDILVDTIINRISEIVREAAHRAAYCGRTEANAYDLIISLSEYDISFNYLVNLIMNLNKYPIPTFDYLTSPYPIATISNFYKCQIPYISKTISEFYKYKKTQNIYQTTGQPTIQEQSKMIVDSIVNDIFVPFRSNTTINYYSSSYIINPPLNNSNTNNFNMAQSNTNTIPGISVIGSNPLNPNPQMQTPDETQNQNSCIPNFFSRLPPEYTYDETPMTDSLSECEAAILEKSREDDQRESKESLAQLNKSSLSDKSYDSSEFELILLKPPEIDKPIGKYADKSGVYQMDGENPGIDPEFMPKLDQRDVNNSLQANSKDIKSMVNILTNSHEKHAKTESEPKNED